MSEQANWIQFRFESDALDPDTFRVVDFEGFGEISSLYEYTINLAASDPDVDLAQLSREPARLVLSRGDQEQKRDDEQASHDERAVPAERPHE